MNTPLLPCPFCGAPPKLHPAVDDSGHQPVECETDECPMSRLWPDLRSWQRRAVQSETTESVESTCLTIQKTVSNYTRRTPTHLRDCDVLTGHIVRALRAKATP